MQKGKSIINQIPFLLSVIVSILLCCHFSCSPVVKYTRCTDDHKASFCIKFEYITDDHFKLLPQKVKYTIDAKSEAVIDAEEHGSSSWLCSRLADRTMSCCHYNLERDGHYKIQVIWNKQWNSHTSFHEVDIKKDEYGCKVKTVYLNETFAPKK